MGDVSNKIADEQKRKQLILAPIGYDALLCGMEYLNRRKMTHSGKLPVASFKTIFNQKEIKDGYFTLVSRGVSPINALHHCLGSVNMRILFKSDDIERSIQIATESYYLIVNPKFEECIRIA